MSDPNNRPSASPENASLVYNFAEQMVELVFKSRLEEETNRNAVDLSEQLFDHLYDVNDIDLWSGRIPDHKDPETNRFVKNLRLLFVLSRSAKGGVLVLNRDVVKDMDKRVFALCMCNDGGDQLDTLCDVVNEENKARVPNVTVGGIREAKPLSGGRSPELTV